MTNQDEAVKGIMGGLAALAVIVGGTVLLNNASESEPVASAPAPTVKLEELQKPATSTPTAHDGVAWDRVSAAVQPAVVSVALTQSQGGAQALSSAFGSGVIIDEAGYVITNNHVVEAANGGQLNVILSNSNVYQVKVVQTDPLTDLALLKMTKVPEGLIALELKTKVTVGDPVMAIGSPLGLSGTVTTGIVSAVGRPLTMDATTNQGQPTSKIIDSIQTSAAINPGNSGGALVDSKGRLVGVNTAIATDGTSQGNIGIGFSIPASTVEHALPYLKAGKPFPHGRVGVMVSAGVAEIKGETMMGALIQEVTPGSPSAKAGLKKGDLIVSVDGVRVAAQDQLVGVVNSKAAGKELELSVIRGKGEETVRVTLAPRDQ